MKKRSVKKTRKVAKKADGYDSLDKIAITAAVLMVLVALGLFYNLGNVGKAIAPPAPPADLSLKESQNLDLSLYGQMEIEMKLSSESSISNFNLAVVENDNIVQYQLTQGGNTMAYGLLSQSLENSGKIYLNDDDIGDMQLSLSGNILTVTNLNYVQPDIAQFDLYDSELNIIDDDVVDAELDQEVSFYLNVTSPSLPQVTVNIDGTPVAVEETDSGSDFVLVKVTFTPSEEKPYPVTVTANIGGEETTKHYILAVDGYVYELAEDGYTVNLHKNNGVYEAIYELEKTSDLQPVSLLCRELDLSQEQDLVNGLNKILTYQRKAEQWKENIPSEFQSLTTGEGYLFDMKENTLTFTLGCDSKPQPETPILNLGWNLVGTNGYKDTKVGDLQTSEGEVAAVYEYGNSAALNVDELTPGKVYWIKVE